MRFQIHKEKNHIRENIENSGMKVNLIFTATTKSGGNRIRKIDGIRIIGIY